MAKNYSQIHLLKPGGLSPGGAGRAALSWSGNHTYHLSLITYHLSLRQLSLIERNKTFIEMFFRLKAKHVLL